MLYQPLEDDLGHSSVSVEIPPFPFFGFLLESQEPLIELGLAFKHYGWKLATPSGTATTTEPPLRGQPSGNVLDVHLK